MPLIIPPKPPPAPGPLPPPSPIPPTPPPPTPPGSPGGAMPPSPSPLGMPGTPGEPGEPNEPLPAASFFFSASMSVVSSLQASASNPARFPATSGQLTWAAFGNASYFTRLIAYAARHRSETGLSGTASTPASAWKAGSLGIQPQIPPSTSAARPRIHAWAAGDRLAGHSDVSRAVIS
ncbi:MAG: hypothetical protein FJ297_14035 [Planctomycetes bacterium]|nr:hypothetical protein [Planctomycetota bacterium]